MELRLRSSIGLTPGRGEGGEVMSFDFHGDAREESRSWWNGGRIVILWPD